MRDSELLGSAIEFWEQGYIPLALIPNNKRPLEPWKILLERKRTAEEIVKLFAFGRPNLALVVNPGLIVMDSETPEVAEEVERKCGFTPFRYRTPGGGTHAWYTGKADRSIKVARKQLDVLPGGTSFCLVPHSEIDGKRYEFPEEFEVPRPERLPKAKLGWLNALRKKTRRKIKSTVTGEIKDIRSYISKIPSEMGSNGSRGLMRVAHLLRDNVGDFDAAMLILQWWNLECATPPWSEPELERALTRAFDV